MVSPIFEQPVVKTLARLPTWPEVKSIKAVGVQVIPDTVASPSLSSTGVRSIAFSVGPAYPQVGRLPIYKVVHLVYHQLKIPLLVLSWSFSHTQEDVRPHAKCENRGRRSLFGLRYIIIVYGNLFKYICIFTNSDTKAQNVLLTHSELSVSKLDTGNETINQLVDQQKIHLQIIC